MILEKNDVQNSPRVKQILLQVNSLICAPNSPIVASRFSFLLSAKFAVQTVNCLNEH